jgi:hypothetical protein
VTCEDSAGAPVAGVQVKCVIYKPLKHPYRKHVSTLTMTSSDTGQFGLDPIAGHFVDLSVLTDGWYASSIRKIPLEAGSYALRLSPTATVKIIAHFEDGEPVSSDAILKRSTGDIWWFKLVDGVGEAKGVATDSDLQCIILSDYRFPYRKHISDFMQSEVASGRELRVIVRPPEQKQGKIRLEIVNGFLTPGQGVMLEQQPGYRASQTSSVRAQQASWESQSLLTELSYRISVLGEQSWRSDWFEISAGEVTVVQATLQASATITAVLVDSAGNPINDAALRISDGGYLPYRAGGKPDIGVQNGALSGKDGRVTLGGIPAGKLTVEAEMWQKEPAVRELDLLPGQTLDMGTLVLDDARGEVFIELVGCADGAEYAVIVDQPSGPTLFPLEAVNGKKHKLSALPLRRYLVGVTFAKGGTIVWVDVDLTGQPSQTIYLDASKVTP